MPENVFYVIFHGLVSLVETPNGFRALLIRMDGHRVAAGHWLTERTIPANSVMTLNGVRAGGASLDPQKNLIVRGARIDQASLKKFRFAEIALPKPRLVHSFLTGIAEDVLTGTVQPTSTSYSAVQVFEYELSADFPDISLAGATFDWECGGSTQLNSGDRVSVLHVLNEPELDADDAHTIEEFRRGSRVLGADLSINAPLPFPRDLPGAPPKGLLVEELLPSGDRQGRVLHLIDFFRAGSQRTQGITIGSSRFCGAPHGN